MKPFWHLEHQGQALIDEYGVALSYDGLRKRADAFAMRLGPSRQLVLAKARNTCAFLVAYLACLRHGHVLMLQPPDINQQTLEHLYARYNPNWYINEEGRLKHRHKKHMPLALDLRVLLTTSGSTGSVKHVMLSNQNLDANAHGICQYLPIDAEDVAMTMLPSFYSYGLSVINSHLHQGACLVLSEHSVVSKAFWSTFNRYQVTHLAGVPATYDILLRMHFERMPLPSLRYLTQAGGALAPEKATYIGRQFAKREIPFYLMYGQTEATARIAWLPPEKLFEHTNCIGQAIAGGKLGLRDHSGDHFSPKPEQMGELIYKGANVMLGYALSAACLIAPEAPPVLATGDIAQYVGQRIYRVIGRQKRITKIQGQRINLDELEQILTQKFGTLACCERDSRLCIYMTQAAYDAQIRMHLQDMGLHTSLYQIKPCVELPKTDSGKINYQVLMQDERSF